MTTKQTIYFAFPYTADKYVLGLFYDQWIGFYNYYFEDLKNIQPSPDTTLSFFLYNKAFSFLQNAVVLKQHFDELLAQFFDKETKETIIYFDDKNHQFKVKQEGIERTATHTESLFYVDLVASEGMQLEALKLRLLELSLGFVPSFQYQIEYRYESFYHAFIHSIDNLDESFKTKERKKAFQQLFKKEMLPFVEKYGFQRHTKTSYRLVKNLEHGLSIFILFEYKRFGYGFYEVKVLYYDDQLGGFEADDYLAMVGPGFPYSTGLHIKSYNKEILSFYVHRWMRIMELYLFPFIEKNTSHQAMLETLKRKSIIDEKRKELQVNKNKHEPLYYFELPFSYSTNKAILNKNQPYINLLKEKAERHG